MCFGTENPKSIILKNLDATQKYLENVQFANRDFKSFFEQEEYKHIQAMQWERVRKDGSLQVFRWKKDPKARRGWTRDKRTCLLFNSNCEREGNDGT